MSVTFETVLAQIRQRAGSNDIEGRWPAEDLRELALVGAGEWAAPPDLGGLGSALELHLRYERIAAASLATSLVVTQRDSALGMIDGAEDWPGRGELLGRLIRDECFATIGIAQLTTSRQGAVPALRARRADGGYRLDGFIPWSTGAAKAAVVVAGAVLDDGAQILFALPMDQSGVKVQPPMPLVALRSSWTTQIDCEDVRLESAQVMRGPVEKALAGRRKGLALGQAFLATGLCRGTIDLIREHKSALASSAAGRFEAQLKELRDQVLALSAPGQEAAAEAGPRLRGGLNDLAIRVTHAAVSIYKGTGLLEGHPAQRLAREAMFLLVWSCPNPVIDCTVDLLAE